ncbi:tRNA (adenosine(37)-N6)-dimethylallyltransferase MiaA [Microcoleus sp. FACHB-1515]|uniref:tRNA (adenosine(37)-N6)-dimethylallyltransferase MiaA n=1 Tax=Cyanophyceae TaxID=3028117 RepID=UPI0016848DC8|nr:tRNA (adenosine(37)-N6)-dimethylallyltransferase MiaA [Microcoleus sp. FACHB-1515]MBD2090873.1 tRNA (adenosine(37)-N6)-dimethylallyltransferase MiaA [Microcoleus sp. FACHB-1515]
MDSIAKRSRNGTESFTLHTSVLLNPSPILIVICGATATGKTALAIAIAQRLCTPTRILNADSRQVYREFDIGTAKPTPEERQLVPHELIDICDPTETLTVADYQERARSIIRKSGSLPLFLVGGTGLYIRSIVRGLKIPRVPPQAELRFQLESIGQAQCYAMLQQVDAIAAAKIHANDQVRTLRALEVFYVTGKPISTQQGEDPPTYPILQIGLDCEDLENRIHQRTKNMVAVGFVEEVDRLCHKYGADLPLLNTLGYAEMKQYLAGKISLEDAIELTTIHTRQFAKRQRTWFRADDSIEWFDSNDSELIDRVWARVVGFLSSRSNSKV